MLDKNRANFPKGEANRRLEADDAAAIGETPSKLGFPKKKRPGGFRV